MKHRTSGINEPVLEIETVSDNVYSVTVICLKQNGTYEIVPFKNWNDEYEFSSSNSIYNFDCNYCIPINYTATVMSKVNG